MKTLIDNESGTLVFIPQSASDKNLLYHLLNCADITQFTEYLKAEQQLGAHAVTSDMGVSVEEFTGYPMTVGTDTRHDRSPLSTMQPSNMMNVLPDFESEIQFDITKTLIGFSRDSSWWAVTGLRCYRVTCSLLFVRQFTLFCRSCFFSFTLKTTRMRKNKCL